MKKSLSLLLALIIAMSAFMGLGFTASAEDADTLAVTVNGETTYVKVGDKFTHTYTITDMEVLCAETALVYDSEYVDPIIVTEEDPEAHDEFLMKTFPRVFSTVVLNYSLEDMLLYNFVSVSGINFSGEKVLAKFEFTALKAGETTIETQMIELADADRNLYVDKTSTGPVHLKDYTYGEYVTYEAPEEPTDPPTEPAKPVKIENIVTNPTDTNIAFSWDAVTDAVKYWVYRFETATNTWKSYTSSSKNEAIAKLLDADTEYQFKVICKFSDGSTMSLDDADVVTVKTLKATATTNITGVADIVDAVISWDAIEGATKYWVYKATAEEGPFYIYNSAYQTSLEVRKLRPDTDYYFRVVALTSNNGIPTISDVNDSPTIHIKTLSSDYISTTLTDYTATSATITWPQFKNADKYWIMYSTTTKDTSLKDEWTSLVSTTDMSKLTYTYKLNNNTTYYLTVCGRYTTDDGEVRTIYHTPVEVRTLYSDEPFLSFTPVDDTSVTVTLPDDLNAQKAWVYAFDESGKQVAVASTTTNTVTLKNLGDYTKCSFKVQVLDNSGKMGYITPANGEAYHI